MGWLLVQTLIMLGGVVALAYLVLNVGLRKLLGLAKVPGGVPAVLKVLEKMPLEPKKSLVLVKAGEAYLLLGLSDQAVSLVARLEKDEVERMQSVSTAGPSQPSPFLTKLLSRRGQTPPPPTPPTE